MASSTRPSPHAAPGFLHVREPDVVLECPLPQADQCKNSIGPTERLADLVALGIVAFDPMLFGLNHVGDERAGLQADRFEFRAEGEIDRDDNQPDRCHQPIRRPKYRRRQ